MCGWREPRGWSGPEHQRDSVGLCDSGSRPRSWQPGPLLGHPDSLCSGDLSPHASLPPFPGLIPEETPENSFLLEGDILRPVSE